LDAEEVWGKMQVLGWAVSTLQSSFFMKV
jgi:hypothetical protein